MRLPGAVLLAALLAPALAAQQPAPSARSGGVIAGVVIDSIRGGTLRGAVVGLIGTPRLAFTDTAGRFQIDGVVPGLHSLEVVHPLLDSVGISVRTSPRMVRMNDTVWTAIALPSVPALVARKCSAADRARGPSALLGSVTDADTDRPSTGAEVVVAWTDYALGESTIDRAPQRRSARVDSAGAFLICGLPDDLVTGVAATRGFDSTAAVLVDFSKGLALLPLRLPPPGGDAARRTLWRGAIRGTVVEATGQKVAGARVAVDEDSAVVLTQSDGAFNLNHLRPGTRLLTVRRLGFEPVELVVDVRADIPRDVPIRLANMVPVLQTVKVTALRELGLSRVGYTLRKGLASGTFFDPEDISRRNSPRLNDLLATAGPLRVRRTNRGQAYIVGRAGGCVTYFVDGQRWSWVGANDPNGGPNAFLSGAEIAAVEVYSPYTSPPEFMGFSNLSKQCSVVVVWTKTKLRLR